MSPDLASFRARAPWWGGHLQTLRNKVVRPSVDLPGRQERLHFALSDGSGDRMTGMLNSPADPVAGPLIVLIHGLSGCEDSVYIRSSAAYHLRRGRRVLRLNLRGAGPSRSTCREHYHSGCAPDIRDALAALDSGLLAGGLFLIGYSFGGNVLLHLLAAQGDDSTIQGAATISASIDPAQAARRMMAPTNALYQRWLLNNMKCQTLAPGARLDEDEREAILGARSIIDFDNVFTAPRNGFASADDYYQATAGWRVVSGIGVPTLLIHARNDPWIPAEPYEVLKREHPSNVEVLLTEGGGHVGFHAKGHQETWHDCRVGAFLDGMAAT